MSLTIRPIVFKGKISTFGGPNDLGVKPTEGLALIEPLDLTAWWFRYLFLKRPADKAEGLARLLNPDAYYIACRWDYSITPKSLLRNSFVKIIGLKNNTVVFARPVDWGPNIDTQRTMDLSPGCAHTLGLVTDDYARAELMTPLINV